jgi:hypothetical protein
MFHDIFPCGAMEIIEITETPCSDGTGVERVNQKRDRRGDARLLTGYLGAFKAMATQCDNASGAAESKSLTSSAIPEASRAGRAR